MDRIRKYGGIIEVGEEVVVEADVHQCDLFVHDHHESIGDDLDCLVTRQLLHE